MNPAPASHADLARFREHRQATEPDTLARMRAVAATASWAAGDIATEASYYRLHYGATLRGDRLDALVGRLRAHASPRDVLKARAIEERLYGETWLAPDYDVTAKLRERAIPTLVIHGDRDFIPLPCARRIADAMPDARLVVLEDCGHFAYLDRPAEVERTIVDFAFARARDA